MRYLWILLFSVFVSPFARADVSNDVIRAYNAALANGSDQDAIIKSAQALAAEAIANPEDDTSILLAYEAGATLCRLGRCADAVAAANYVNTRPVTDPKAYTILEDRALLAALANWETDKTRKTRRELDRVLDNLIETVPSQLSLQAFEARYNDDLSRGRIGRAAMSAEDASHHLRPIADLIPQQYVEAERTSAISMFNSDQDPEARRRIAHLQGWLGQQRRLAGADAPDWMKQEEDAAYAWGLAMDAWFTSSGRDGISAHEMNAILAGYRLNEGYPAESHLPADIASSSESLPFCKGALKKDPELLYTGRQVRRGFFGAVILGFDIEDGLIINPQIHASIPEKEFEDQALKTVSQWVWVADEGQMPGIDCSMSRQNIVQPLVFTLD